MRFTFLLFAPALLCLAQQQQQKPDPVFAPVADELRLPRVLLIGDSISMGYTLPVRKLLAGKANVHRIPENGGPTSRGAQKIVEWLRNGRWDVIHFNFGLHDLRRMDNGEPQVSLEDYEKNLRSMIESMKKTKAVLIFATTTPVPDGKVSPPRVPGDVARYNETALKVMRENGIAIDDLYAFAMPRLAEIQRPVNVHFTDAGSAALAAEVVKHIEEALKQRGDRYFDRR